MTRPLQRDDTIARIYDVANQDVVMRDPPSGVLWMYLVLDTNVLIDQLPVLKRFSKDVEAFGIPLTILIPNVVLSELDGLKNRDEVKWFAQTASSFLLEQVKLKKMIKVQARAETCNITTNDDLRKNDNAIFDCCCYFQTKGSVVLASADKNLSIECEGHIPVIPTIQPPKRPWSSRALAQVLFFGDNHDHPALRRFHAHEGANYRRSRSSKHFAMTEAPGEDDDNGMDIDDEDMTMVDIEELIPSHALDALHLQVIDHFTLVLRELADRIRVANGDAGSPNGSRYAPAYRRKSFEDWTLGDCLEYLKLKGSLPKSDPELGRFLLRPYEKVSEYGSSRRGQDWSRQDWNNVLKALENIGQKFGDGVVLWSLEALRPHVEVIFNTPMRPTGI